MLENTFRPVRRLFRLPLSPQRFFLLVAVPVTFSLVFIIPPFQAPDEHTHFYKEVYQSRGQLIAHPLPTPHRVGDYLPAKYSETVGRYTYMFLDHTQKLNETTFNHDIQYPIRDNTPTLTDFENTAQYPPLAYLPQSIAIFLMHLFTGSVLLQMYAARLATAVCWLVLVFLAIRFLPFTKWGAVALSLTPLSLFLATSCSNDAITFGICLLFIAATLKAVVTAGRLQNRERWLLYGLAAALAFCKPPYFILTALALAIPVKRFGSKKNYWTSLAMLFGVTLAIAIAWEALVRPILLNFYPDSNTANQISYIQHNPVTTLEMIIKTLLRENMALQLVSLRLWMDIQTPFWLTGLDYVLILFAVIYRPAGEKAVLLSSAFARYLSLVIATAGVMLVSALLYITYTPVGMYTIIGLQGRYFIPFSYLLIPLAGGTRSISPRLKKPIRYGLMAGMVFVSVCVWPLVINRYY